MSDDFNFFLPLSKIDAKTRTVSGYASTPALDLDGEVVSLDAVRKALPGYWEYRNVREMHTNSAVGVGKEANIDEKGLFLTAKIVDDAAWTKCVEGVYKGFSIGGRKLAKSGNTITEIEWIETSIVDRPANPECRFTVAKRAKDPAPAYLVKARVARDPSSRALSKMAQAVEILAKNGPSSPENSPAAARLMMCKAHSAANCPDCMCKAHGVVDCEKCSAAKVAEVEKRDVSRKERKGLAQEGKALPGGGFPINNKDDLNNARQAFGRAKNKKATRNLIVRRARELGVGLPKKWSKKLAKRLIAEAEVESLSLEKAAAFDLDLPVSKRMVAEHESAEALDLSGADDQGPDLGDFAMSAKTAKTVAKVAIQEDPFEKYVELLEKAGRAPSRAMRMQMARTNLKKARDVRKECSAAIRDAHAMHKAAYLAKAAGKKKPTVNGSGDSDDFDHAGAMEKLQKAYGELEKLGTFIKAANIQLKKAASRSGQEGQEAGDPESGFYEVPPGVKDINPNELDTAGPGGHEKGSEPQILGMDMNKPFKVAKRKDGMVTAQEAELLVRAAAAEARAEALEKLPMGPVNGRRPAVFDMSRFDTGVSNADLAPILKGVDTKAIGSGDEAAHVREFGKMLGNMVLSGHGAKPVLDSNFHGTAGLKSN